MKGVFVVLDGVADEGCKVLNGKTPLEAAKTANLDYFAEHGKLDYCDTVKKDYVPESNEGVLSLLGYDSFSVGRGALEALGLGIQLKNGDLAFRCNFGSVEDIEEGNILDRRAGRTLTTKEARILSDSINKNVKLPFKFEFYPSIQHRGVLVIRGGFSDNISNVEAKNGKLSFSKVLDEDDDSQLSADLVNGFVRKSHEVLDKHPINIARAKKGLFSANVVLCRGAESDRVRLKKLRGKWIALGYMPLEKGIAKAAKMEVHKFSYPRLKNMDVYANLHLGLKKAIKNSIKMLKRNRKKYDYFYVHFKECDIPGHDNKPLEKVKMIELIDKWFFGFLKKYVKNGKLVVTADHATSCRQKSHTDDPVPVLSYPSTTFKKGSRSPKGDSSSGKRREGQRFTEEHGLRGKRFVGKNVLRDRFFGK